MFDITKSKDKNEKIAKRKALNTVKEWCLQIVPVELQEGLLIDVKEVVCGDPSCAPIDTVVTLVWNSGGTGMFGIPSQAELVEQEDLMDNFPDDDVLAAWKAGQEAEWPRRPELRFPIGTRVECRIGPHPGDVVNNFLFLILI